MLLCLSVCKCGKRLLRKDLASHVESGMCRLASQAESESAFDFLGLKIIPLVIVPPELLQPSSKKGFGSSGGSAGIFPVAIASLCLFFAHSSQPPVLPSICSRMLRRCCQLLWPVNLYAPWFSSFLFIFSLTLSFSSKFRLSWSARTGCCHLCNIIIHYWHNFLLRFSLIKSFIVVRKRAVSGRVSQSRQCRTVENAVFKK